MKKILAWRLPKTALGALVFVLALISTLAFKGFADKPACAISLNKMNIFYIGVENPVDIIVRGVPADQVLVTGQGLTIQKREGDNYLVQARAPGAGSITVRGGDLAPTTFHYRVKRIPDPELLLGGQYRSGPIGNGVFKAQNGLGVVFGENFDFDVQCDVVGYEVTYWGKQRDPAIVKNLGGRFTRQARELISLAKPGDNYFFDDVRVKCPGDDAARSFGSLVFQIK